MSIYFFIHNRRGTTTGSPVVTNPPLAKFFPLKPAPFTLQPSLLKITPFWALWTLLDNHDDFVVASDWFHKVPGM